VRVACQRRSTSACSRFRSTPTSTVGVGRRIKGLSPEELRFVSFTSHKYDYTNHLVAIDSVDPILLGPDWRSGPKAGIWQFPGSNLGSTETYYHDSVAANRLRRPWSHRQTSQLLRPDPLASSAFKHNLMSSRGWLRPVSVLDLHVRIDELVPDQTALCACPVPHNHEGVAAFVAAFVEPSLTASRNGSCARTRTATEQQF
jgi:hypothetical protein